MSIILSFSLLSEPSCAQQIESVGGKDYVLDRSAWYARTDDGKAGDEISTETLIVRLHGRLHPGVLGQYGQSGTRVTGSKPLGYGFFRLRVPTGLDPFEYARALEASDRFEVIEFNTFGKLTAEPNDSEYTGESQWWPDTLRLPSAWDVVPTTSDVIVAVLDTGTDYGHPDVDDNLWSAVG
ncbi:MAG: hypothetical protein HKN13_15070, partial [Rhodothermales bacterium]|nr:hypothetical protein [Rhodothermales bacterium]